MSACSITDDTNWQMLYRASQVMRCRVFSALANLQSRKALPSCAALQQLMPSAIRLTHIWSVSHVQSSMPALSGHCCDLRLSYQRSTLQIHHCGKVLCKMPQLIRLHMTLHGMNTVRIAFKYCTGHQTLLSLSVLTDQVFACQ